MASKSRGLFLKIVGVFAVILLVLAVVIATRPAHFHIERSVLIRAWPQLAFQEVNDFHRWGAWSPWDKMDPAMKRTYSGPESGVGASYAWAGNGQVGEGRMTIESSEPSTKIAIRLEFLKPMAATNVATFTFHEEAGGVKVTWGMDGDNGFMGKAFSLVMDMDHLVGADFERGLASLKEIAEKADKEFPRH